MKTTQTVIAKLRNLHDRDRFIELTKSMALWLYSKPGFLSYSFFENGTSISDSLTYDSVESADKINAEFKETSIYSEMIKLVEPDYVSFFGHEVFLDLERHLSPEKSASE